AIGAYWSLMNIHPNQSCASLKLGVYVGLLFCLFQLFPTGDQHGKMVAKHQPAALAAMEGKFESGDHAELAIIGQPDVKSRKLENPVIVPGVLSYLAYGSFGAMV